MLANTVAATRQRAPSSLNPTSSRSAGHYATVRYAIASFSRLFNGVDDILLINVPTITSSSNCMVQQVRVNADHSLRLEKLLQQQMYKPDYVMFRRQCGSVAMQENMDVFVQTVPSKSNKQPRKPYRTPVVLLVTEHRFSLAILRFGFLSA